MPGSLFRESNCVCARRVVSVRRRGRFFRIGQGDPSGSQTLLALEQLARSRIAPRTVRQGEDLADVTARGATQVPRSAMSAPW